MNTFKIEKTKLLTHIGNDDTIKLLKEAKCFIAGGAITSLFSGKEINDVDVYFRDFKSLVMVLGSLFNDSDEDEETLDIEQFNLVYTNHTKKSILFTKDELDVQFIYFKFFKDAEEIFSTFDFTVNMGVYDCATEEFILHDNFLKDIAQRKLIVNPNTSYPIISLLRIDKYKEKGYEISRKDFVNLCLAVNKLNISSWEQLADSIGGMYGYTYTDLFDTTKEFTIDEAISQLTKVETNLNSVAIVSGTDYYGLIDQIRKNLNIPTEPETMIFYKKVINTKIDNTFQSYYKKEFKYEVGKSVNGGEMGIWAYNSIDRAKAHAVLYPAGDSTIIILQANETVKIVKNRDKTYNLIGNVLVLGKI